jgi:hypothetical protein
MAMRRRRAVWWVSDLKADDGPRRIVGQLVLVCDLALNIWAAVRNALALAGATYAGMARKLSIKAYPFFQVITGAMMFDRTVVAMEIEKLLQTKLRQLSVVLIRGRDFGCTIYLPTYARRAWS